MVIGGVVDVLGHQYHEEERWENGLNDSWRCFQSVLAVSDFLEDFFNNPPNNMTGRYLTDQKVAWETNRTQWLREAEQGLDVPSPVPDLFQRIKNAGLSGLAAAAKFRPLRDAIEAWRNIRNSFTAERVLRLSVNLLGSIAGLVGAAEGIKELCEALKYIADRAVEKREA